MKHQFDSDIDAHNEKIKSRDDQLKEAVILAGDSFWSIINDIQPRTAIDTAFTISEQWYFRYGKLYEELLDKMEKTGD